MFAIPKISCLMVTTGRTEMIRRSTECFLKQTYPHKELIVLSQGNNIVNDKIANYFESLNRKNIQFIRAPECLSLGAMRNLSIELSTGTVLAQWDDDDFHHPLRLTTQYSALNQQGVVASLYMEHLKFFETTGEIYWIDWSLEIGEDRRYLPGTAMFPKSVFYRFDNLLYPESGRQSSREEDWNVLQKFCSLGKIAPVRAGYQYIYTFHGNNTYWLEHHKYVLKKRVYDEKNLLGHKKLIINSLELCNTGPANVCSLNGPVFAYEPSNFCT